MAGSTGGQSPRSQSSGVVVWSCRSKCWRLDRASSEPMYQQLYRQILPPTPPPPTGKRQGVKSGRKSGVSHSPETPIRYFKLHKRRQLFLRTHNETLSVVAMRVCDPDITLLGIDCCDTAQTPAGFLKIVSDDFPILHAARPTLLIEVRCFLVLLIDV